MAEAVGLVASGISIGTLAIQITISLNKLRSYWNDVKDAPQTLMSLIEDIESLNLILTDMEDDQARNPISSMLLNSTSSSRCIEHCRKAARRLQELIDELSQDLGSPSKFKRVWASNRAVLKKDKLDHYKAKLESTIRLLTLSHQYYTSSLIQLQPDIIVARISQTNTSLQVTNPQERVENSTRPVITHTNHITSFKRPSQRRVQQQTIAGYLFGSVQVEKTEKDQQRRCEIIAESYRDIYACLRAPAWLINRTWEIQARHACSGWEFKFTAGRSHAFDSPVASIIRNDDIEGLKVLLQSGEVSLYDTVSLESGRSFGLLQYAANGGHVNVCNLLLDCGAYIEDEVLLYDKRRDFADYILTIFSVNGMFVLEQNNLQNSPVSASLFRRILNSTTLINIKCLYGFCGTFELFLMMQEKCYPEYYENDINTRMKIAAQITRISQQNDPRVFRKAISNTGIDSYYWDWHGKRQHSLLHSLCTAIGSHFGRPRNRGLQIDEGWLELLKEAVSDGNAADREIGLRRLGLVCTRYYLDTPFICLLRGFCTVIPFYYSRMVKDAETPLTVYLTAIKAGGIDLEKYGRQEQAIIAEIGGINFHTFSLGWELFEVHLIGLAIGPNPGDWKLWFSEPTDIFAGEFWHMIENPWENMPGAWLE